jgi:bacterioferritin
MTTSSTTTAASAAYASPEIMHTLGQIFEMEMAGIIRYMHYSFMIMGYNRIPIQAWFREQATESMQHAVIIGEKITALGGHPPLVSAPIEDTKTHSIDEILRESLAFETATLSKYKELVGLSGDDIALEELARGFVKTETEHIEEVQKMLRRDR